MSYAIGTTYSKRIGLSTSAIAEKCDCRRDPHVTILWENKIHSPSVTHDVATPGDMDKLIFGWPKSRRVLDKKLRPFLELIIVASGLGWTADGESTSWGTAFS